MFMYASEVSSFPAGLGKVEMETPVHSPQHPTRYQLDSKSYLLISFSIEIEKQLRIKHTFHNCFAYGQM